MHVVLGHSRKYLIYTCGYYVLVGVICGGYVGVLVGVICGGYVGVFVGVICGDYVDI